MTDDVVSGVDRREHRVEVSRGPKFRRGGDQDDRVRPVGQTLFKRPGPADSLARHDKGIGGATSFAEEVEQPLSHLIRRSGRGESRAVGVRPRIDHDHPDPAAGDRRTQSGGVEWVNPAVITSAIVRQRCFEFADGSHDSPSRPANQRSTAER